MNNLMSELSKNIVYLRERRRMTQEQYAALVGTTQATISRIEKGKNATADTLMKISATEGTSVAALHNDKLWRGGKEAGETRSEIQKITNDEYLKTYDNICHDHITVEIKEFQAGEAGQIRACSMLHRPLSSSRIWNVPESWVESDLMLSPENTMIIRIEGNAMSPLLEPGDRVIIDTRSRDPRQSATYALRDGDVFVVRFVQVLKSSPPMRIICRHANPSFLPVEVDLDDGSIEIVGRVAARISKL